jgi:hypothetical protein
MKPFKYSCCVVFCLASLFSCAGILSDEENITELVSDFQSAVNSLSSSSLAPLVSTSADDYDLITAGTYFAPSGDGDLFSTYRMTYSNVLVTVNGDNGTATATVSAADRNSGIPVSFAVTATFTVIKENGRWVIRELKQVKTGGGGEEVLLDEIDRIIYDLLESLPDGKILR